MTRPDHRLGHLYIPVSDSAPLRRVLGSVFRAARLSGKGTMPIGGEPHAHYWSRALQITLRPAHVGLARTDSYAVGSSIIWR